ncbi:hypothetical protein QAD02_017952 [Eretmocerus hayati]|uniref:Uncharacterized protein n=1 Tax=Eretmocerus hayati TaxID=131215 RepID=A0ACC2PFE3_9HYME|nr:hypothetical protein QAD02_017952 [Eretmocerus hayati]
MEADLKLRLDRVICILADFFETIPLSEEDENFLRQEAAKIRSEDGNKSKAPNSAPKAAKIRSEDGNKSKAPNSAPKAAKIRSEDGNKSKAPNSAPKAAKIRSEDGNKSKAPNSAPKAAKIRSEDGNKSKAPNSAPKDSAQHTLSEPISLMDTTGSSDTPTINDVAIQQKRNERTTGEGSDESPSNQKLEDLAQHTLSEPISVMDRTGSPDTPTARTIRSDVGIKSKSPNDKKFDQDMLCSFTILYHLGLPHAQLPFSSLHSHFPLCCNGLEAELDEEPIEKVAADWNEPTRREELLRDM